MDLKNKSILFFAPAFFGYEKAIRERLSELAAVVDYFDERPSNTFWTKAFIRLYPELIHSNIKNYYEHIYELIQGKVYDYVFIINLEAMPRTFLKQIRIRFTEAKFILYMWDSISNKKNIVHYLSYFDSVFSFDKIDCENIPNIQFRPLFFLNEYGTLAKYQNVEYDLIFVGTAHSDRFQLIQKVRQQIQNKKINFYFYLYLQNWKLFIWHKLKNKDFRDARLRDFHYVPLSNNELFELIKKSRIILDIQHPKQSGLTMRTIEVLGAGRKLITTNSEIKWYDFYNPNNILIIDRAKPEIPDFFFEIDYQPLSSEIYYKYSLDGWLADILHFNIMNDI